MRNLHHDIKDYMGNNRMVVNRDGTIEQITHYYPYGPRSHRESIFMLSARRRGFSRGQVIGDISTNESLQKFKFEGKVLAAIEKIDNLRREDEPLGEGKDRTFGLDSYDIEARQYFSMAPMWDRPDSKAEDYYGISPYVFCLGDPVNFGDFNGKELYTFTPKTGLIWQAKPTAHRNDPYHTLQVSNRNGKVSSINIKDKK